MEKSSKEKEVSKVCKRCKQTYNPASNSSTSCRFHPSFFVCRRHDDQKRSRGSNLGHSTYSPIGTRQTDQKKRREMYYELGPDDPPYAAKFYDCCGAEDPEASGCTSNFHVSYDED
ncbi:hypothetical protein L195_g014497 [Trifolium pratense]|uniref:Uncharacterized protein n=1 Tax=Trifolium pratense TaxID=57577 RepID=A0A2K3PR33_TRIPR|nr:hypothetical protein L195_g014497 [Trifolium pratense]